MWNLPLYSSNKRKGHSSSNANEMEALYDKEMMETATTTTMYGASSPNRPITTQSRSSLASANSPSVRFQVVIWYIGPIDVVLGLVTMKFRISIFWNAPSAQEHAMMSTRGYGNYDSTNRRVWSMHGRQRAYQRELPEMLDRNLIYVPPVSILNALQFTCEGEPEICLINEQHKTFKWTCMYTAKLIQEHLRVDSFPHDKHELVLKLGIMKHRRRGKRWDRRRWTVGLATDSDSQNTIRIPHGLVVDHVQIPEFDFDHDRQLRFAIEKLQFGPKEEQDECLEVSITASRRSAYYDKNIIPLLALLNLVGISTLALDALEFGARAQVILAVAFVAMGLRLTVDSKLPQVGYQIKLQRILNRFFYTLLFMHVESSIVYTMIQHCDFDYEETSIINVSTMVVCSLYTLVQLWEYYKDLL